MQGIVDILADGIDHFTHVSLRKLSQKHLEQRILHQLHVLHRACRIFRGQLLDIGRDIVHDRLLVFL